MSRKYSSMILGVMALAFAAGGPVSAQMADTKALAAQQTAQNKFAWMDGTWRGTAVTRGPAGEHRVTHTERVGTMLGGTIRVIEGKSFNDDGSVGFNAFAVISFDPAKSSYDFRSFAQGRAGNMVIVPNADGYVWEIPAAGIRYTATFTDKVWTEIGERIVPGKPAVQFFEMKLTRVGDTSWPDGGAMTPK